MSLDKENRALRTSGAAKASRFGRGVLHWGETAENLFLLSGLSGAAAEERLKLAERVQQRPDDAAAWWALLEHVSQRTSGATEVCKLYRRATQCIPKNRPELNESEPYVLIWLGFAKEQQRCGRRDDATEALRYMRNEGIGRRSAAFYLAWAECEAGAGRPHGAREAVTAGARCVPLAKRTELVELTSKSDVDLVAALEERAAQQHTATTASLSSGGLRRQDIDYMFQWQLGKDRSATKAAPKPVRKVAFAEEAPTPKAPKQAPALAPTPRAPPAPTPRVQVPKAPAPAKRESQSSSASPSMDSSSESSDDERPRSKVVAAKKTAAETGRTPSSSSGTEPAIEDETVDGAMVREAFLGLVSPRNLVRVDGQAYAKLGLVGRGGSSKVFRVLDAEGRILALKRVRLRGDARESLAGYANEITLLRRLAGKPGIIRLHAADVDEPNGSINMIMEAGEADLATVLSRRKEGAPDGLPPLSHGNFVRLAWQQMLDAVETIHQDRIVHGDLKPANFLFVQGQLRLIDFGIARAIKNDTTNVYRDAQIGTLNYMSPEAIRDTNVHVVPAPAPVAGGNWANRLAARAAQAQRRKPTMRVGRASDVWSLGCILYQMIYGRTPFGHLHLYAKLQAICNPHHEIALPDAPLASDDALDCLRGCLQREPLARPPIAGRAGLLTHRYLEPPVQNALPPIAHLRAALRATAGSRPPIPGLDLDALAVQLHHHLSLVADEDPPTDAPAVLDPPPPPQPRARQTRRRSIVDRGDRRMLTLAEENDDDSSSTPGLLARP